ncbi:flavin reductase family protein [Hamadaea tsunoensis]|uniref:flavin reductase family protein n=1 Tax=Hamadaea tsunoensis TaxID=53368 RepID=UPI00040704C4|nr:flavin reductase family protein [Hamadaea tsunoensis]
MTLTAEPDAGLSPAGIDPHLFLNLLRRHASAVTVVTAPPTAGLPQVGFTATSFTSVSLRPQIVSFCLDRDSTSWPTVERAPHVAVHVLAAGQRALARNFATRGIDRFADTATWRRGPYGMPLLQGVAATLVAEVIDRVHVGDHAIVLARPITGHHTNAAPLLYHDGGYHRIGEADA